MEAAPLTLAHAHARRASHETAKSKLTIAATEHESAAAQFAKAADQTRDNEALRILKLLQDHHKTLAAIIKTKDSIARKTTDAATRSARVETRTVEEKPSSPPPTADASTHQNRPSASALSKVSRQRRETSPALAKDMASRRGIPQPVLKKTQPSTDVRSSFVVPPDVTAPRRKHTTKHHEMVEAPTAESAAHLPPKQPDHNSDEGFSRFYANLSSGPLAKISSMLAFAALPLTEPPSQPVSPTSSRTESTVKAYSGPDARTLISPAALSALEEQQRRQGASGQVFNPAESFYVVQPSGGTASYANIMRSEHRHAKRQHGHLTGISEEDLNFVDARETQGSKSGAAKSAETGAGLQHSQGHRVEELELENDTLKQVLDQMSHRLQAFERSAQDASMAALTQSMASVRTQGIPGIRLDEGAGDRERIMEAELQNAVDEITRLKADNKDLKKWKRNIQEGARVRRGERGYGRDERAV